MFGQGGVTQFRDLVYVGFEPFSYAQFRTTALTTHYDVDRLIDMPIGAHMFQKPCFPHLLQADQ